jgi:hypothetical protein
MTKTGTTTSATYETTVQVYGREPYTRRVKKIGELFGAVRIEFEDGHQTTTAAGEFHRDYRRVNDTPTAPAPAKTATCLRCGRKLTASSSIARGYGRVCRLRIRAATALAATVGYQPFQLAKANDLIGEQAIVPTGRPALYLAVSSDGTTTYLVDAVEHSCTCPARADCYHLAAGDILTAA